jgi:hypothetical protein
MPRVLLNDWHVSTLLSMAGVGPIGEGSPLRSLHSYPRPIAPGEPDWGYLVDKRLVVDDGDGWRVNSVVAGVLRACATPDEVVHVGVGDEENPGFSVVRRGELVAECTIARAGTTKLYFPLTRSDVILSMISALSGDDDPGAPKPSGFHFVGRAEDAFVLGAALRELRSDTLPFTTVAGLKQAVARYALEPKLTIGFTVIGHGDAMEGLATSPRKVDAAIKRLVAEGHLKLVRDKLKVSAPAEAALTKWPTGIFALNHVEVAGGVAKSKVMQAMRVGGRTLVFRPRLRPGHTPEFEWSEVTKRELRALVAGMLLRDEELEAFLGAKRVPAGAAKKAAAARPAPRRAPAPAAVVAAAPEPAPWAPSHAVPAGGMAAWATPDGSQPAVATLDPALPVQVIEQHNGWAHIVCSNGWEAWVNGGQLTPGV